MFGLRRFPFYEVHVSEFCMSMSDHIKQQVYKDFCQKGLIHLKNGKTGFLCFTRVGEPALISKISYLFEVETVWHTVFICCTMCGTEQPNEQPQIGDRGLDPVAISQFLIFFSLLGPHVLVLCFHLLIFFILRGLLYLI